MNTLQSPTTSRLPVGPQRGIRWVMAVYFLTGLVGSVFLGVLLLRDFGYITFEPYEYYAAQYFLLIGFGLLMSYGWIVGIILIILYRHSWSVVTPAIVLVVSRFLSILSNILVHIGVSLPFITYAEYAAIHVYCIAALLIGGGWLVRNFTRGDVTWLRH
jgi:hypothetical protein